MVQEEQINRRSICNKLFTVDSEEMYFERSPSVFWRLAEQILGTDLGFNKWVNHKCRLYVCADTVCGVTLDLKQSEHKQTHFKC